MQDAYKYLNDLIEEAKLRKGREQKRKDWILILGNISFAREARQITTAEAVELVEKLRLAME